MRERDLSIADPTVSKKKEGRTYFLFSCEFSWRISMEEACEPFEFFLAMMAKTEIQIIGLRSANRESGSVQDRLRVDARPRGAFRSAATYTRAVVMRWWAAGQGAISHGGSPGIDCAVLAVSDVKGWDENYAVKYSTVRCHGSLCETKACGVWRTERGETLREK